MDAWHDFFIAIAGASGALVGLLFVALSINLDQLMGAPHLLMRAAANLGTLVNVLAISCLMLTPDLALKTLGGWILALAIVGWGAVTWLSWRGVQDAAPQFRRYQVLALAMLQLTTLPTVLAGVMVWHREEEGLLWLVPAFLAALVLALMNSWVLMVETRR